MESNTNTPETQVVLEIEDREITCDKEVLSEHSDYFRVMFNGNFIEKHQDVIKLKDISFAGFDEVLKLIRNPLHDLNDSDLLLAVFEVCVLLQFNNLMEMLIPMLKDSILVQNCIKFWKTVDYLGLDELALDLKTLCLINFETIRQNTYSKQLELLNLQQLYNYLADIKLNCTSEYHVFEACMSWWNWYSEKNTPSIETCEQAFSTFLCCMDFKNLSSSEISEMASHPKFSQNEKIVGILKDMIHKKQKTRRKPKYAKCFRKLCLSETRIPMTFCILFYTSCYAPTLHKRKRSLTKSKSGASVETKLNVAYYDESKGAFEILHDLCSHNWYMLDGFKAVEYQGTVYIVGGENGLGSGHWNKSVHAYNLISKTLKNIEMPVPRRHFLLVAGDDCLYIIGGIGTYRKQEYDMFYYNVAKGTWSNLIELPFSGAAQGGYANNQLIIIEPSLMNLHIFNHNTSTWQSVNIELPESIPTPLVGKYEVLIHSNYIYFKGMYFIQFILQGSKLEAVYTKKLEGFVHFSSKFLCTSDSVMYSIYMDSPNVSNDIIIEKYCTDEHVSTNVTKVTLEGTHYFADAFIIYDCFTKKSGVINKIDF